MRISDWCSDVCSSDLSSITVDTAAAPVDGVTKTSFAGGKASIVQAGNAADAEDSVRGNLNATGLNGAEVTVSAKARNVIASAGGVTETVGGSNAVTSGTVTTTTVRSEEHTSELQSLMRN